MVSYPCCSNIQAIAQVLMQKGFLTCTASRRQLFRAREASCKKAIGCRGGTRLPETTVPSEELQLPEKKDVAEDFNQFFDFLHSELACTLRRDRDRGHGETPWCLL